MKNKGGRPKKENKRSQQLAVMCTAAERNIISEKAKSVNLSISEFLRELALKGQVDRRIKSLPREVLQITATLNHLAANMNQLARKKNQVDKLTDAERLLLSVLCNEVKDLAVKIKFHLQ